MVKNLPVGAYPDMAIFFTAVIKKIRKCSVPSKVDILNLETLTEYSTAALNLHVLNLGPVPVPVVEIQSIYGRSIA